VHQLDEAAPKPCLIILDINMPGRDGKKILKDLRTRDGYEELPIVLFSTSNLPSEAAFAQSYQAGFVTKPLSRRQIHQVFDDLIGHCSEEIKKRLNNQRDQR
jgi:CheY-like chemotaxis protein